MSKFFAVEELIAALQEIVDMPGATLPERFYRSSKLRAVRTELSGLIKAQEASK